MSSINADNGVVSGITGVRVTADSTGNLALQSNGVTVLTLATNNTATFAGTLTTASQGIAYSSLPAGSVLQVVNATYSTATSTSGTTLIDSGLTASITPKFSTSKILVIANMSGLYNGGTANTGINMWVLRNSTNIIQFAGITNYLGSANTLLTNAGTSYLDSPATTSATTYKVQFARILGSGTVGVQNNSDTSTITLMEIAA